MWGGFPAEPDDLNHTPTPIPKPYTSQEETK